MTDIVERLRLNGHLHMANEAAAEIERLRRESQIMAEAFSRSSQEIERLRAELRRITEHYDLRDEMYTNDADLVGTMADIARHALEDK